MGGIVLGTNLSALMLNRRLSESTEGAKRAFERLGSGLRINRASDDAAGLAVSSGLNADARIYAQAVRNVNDGLSLLAIADNALESLSSILTRVQELSAQAANGALSGKQRLALDREAQELSEEYSRIITTTEFGGQKILSGDYGVLRLQAGFSMLSSNLGGAVGDGTFLAPQSFSTANWPLGVTLADLNGDDKLDLIGASSGGTSTSVLLGNGDGSFQAKRDYDAGSNTYSVSAGDLNNDGKVDLLVSLSASTNVAILLGNGDGTFNAKLVHQVGGGNRVTSIEDFNQDGSLDFVSGNFDGGSATVWLGNGDGSFKFSASFAGSAHGVDANDFNNDGFVDIAYTNSGSALVKLALGNGDGSFANGATYTVDTNPYDLKSADLNSDGIIDLISANSSGDSVSILIGLGDGSFKSAVRLTAGDDTRTIDVSDLNGDGFIDVVAANMASDSLTAFFGNGDGSFRAYVSIAAGDESHGVTIGDVNKDGVADLVSSSRTASNLSVYLGNSESGAEVLAPFSLRTRQAALSAIDYFAEVRSRLGIHRGQIGALQSRASTAVSNLSVMNEEYRTAAAQIADADVADETVKLVRSQILQQSGSALLAQANQESRLALSLIESSRK